MNSFKLLWVREGPTNGPKLDRTCWKERTGRVPLPTIRGLISKLKYTSRKINKKVLTRCYIKLSNCLK